MTTASALEVPPREHVYRAGLSRHREAVVSSHFMDAIARNRSLQPYSTELLAERARFVSPQLLDDVLIPVLVKAAREFAMDRALAAVERARAKAKEYGLDDPALVGEAEAIAEVMFDRQFSRKASLTRSRRAVRDEIAALLDRGRSIELVIPALPFKILCPLKARGVRPDFAEVDLLLSLFEIACAIEAVSRRLAPDVERLAARFLVISDGRRFASIVNVATATINDYCSAVEVWIRRLGLADHVVIKDYWELLNERLPPSMLKEKHKVTSAAQRLYCKKLDPAFDTFHMRETLAVSRTLEPDPENENHEGRFASLFKSLVYTVNYRVLDVLALPLAEKYSLYRSLTSHLFDPFEDSAPVPGTDVSREAVRQAMLKEVWQATIAYMAEIKSDRDLERDPILCSLPDAIRWTIHAKAGQFAIRTPAVNGAFVQAWAGSGFFRSTTKGAVKLCAYPVLGLEGQGAVPVFETEENRGGQPLFYVDSDLMADDMNKFLHILSQNFTRRRLR